MTIEDLQSERFQELMVDVIKEAELQSLSRVCFVAEDKTEELLERDEVLDAVDSDDEEYFKATRLPTEVEDALIKEEELLEEIPLPGFPTHELERKKKWLKIPRRARTAIRRMHREWGHMPRSVLKGILRMGKAPMEYIAAVDH